MSKQNQKKPLTNKQYEIVFGNDDLVDAFLLVGCRVSEMVAIINTWEGQDHISVPVKNSKSGKSIFYLIDEVVEILKRLKKKYRGGTTAVRTISRHIKNASTKLGVDFTAHNLRATFATRLVQNGVDTARIQRLMNHSDISTTSAYIMFNERDLRVAQQSLVGSEVSIEGMTLMETQKEVLRLRSVNMRTVSENKQLRSENKRLRDEIECLTNRK